VAEADATMLTEYRGLKVHELAELRASLRPTGTEYKVFKNTLARRAMDGAELDGVVSLLEGPVAIAFVRGDAAAAAKALRDFGRNNPALVVKGGLLGGTLLEPPAIEALADLPSRDVLLAQIAGAFQAPLVKAAGLFQALPRNLAYGVKALIDQRVAGGEAAPVEEPPAEEPPAEEPPAAAASEPTESE
jgi:large subunit ribosomal protein L10